MTDKVSAPSKNQILTQVKSLCVHGKFAQSRELICQTAGIKTDNPMKIARQQIREQNQNATIHKMLDIEQAFASLAITFRDAEPKEYNAQETIKQLQKVIPLLNRDEKAFTYYWISNCWNYIDPVDQGEQFKALRQVIKLTKNGTNDQILYYCSNKISCLEAPYKDKYEAIKMASLKTPKHSPYKPHYEEMLNKHAHNYFDELTRLANHPSYLYSERSAAYETAIELVNDFKMSAAQKCSYKIGLLNSLEKIQKAGGDKQGLHKTYARKQNFIYQSAQIKRRQNGYRILNENYR